MVEPPTTPLDEVRDTFVQLLDWAEVVRAPFRSAPGSELEVDTTVWPWLSTGELARQAVSAGLDHLKGFRAWLHVVDDYGLFPFGTFSLLRGALVGGALATWLLASDESDVRLGRSLQVAAEHYRHFIRYAETVEPIALDPVPFAEDLKRMRDRAAEVKALRVGRVPTGHLNMTDVITQATSALWPSDSGRAIATKALWQTGSGDAHALGWAAQVRGHEREPEGGGMATIRTSATSKEVADAYLCAYDFVAFGFHRLDELGGS